MMAIGKLFQHAHVDALLLTRVSHFFTHIRLKFSFLTKHFPSESAILDEQDNIALLCYWKRKQQSLALA